MFFAKLLLLSAVSATISINAQQYKIGSKIFISKKEIDKVVAGIQKSSKKPIDQDEIIKNIVATRKLVLTLKLAKSIPEHYQAGIGLTGYEADLAILQEYIKRLKSHFTATTEEIEAMRNLYEQINVKRVYTLREIQASSDVLASIKRAVHLSTDKSSMFIMLAKKHSQSLSASSGGLIGDYNPQFDSTTAMQFTQLNKYEMLQINDTLYFVEDIIEYAMPNNQQLADVVSYEKLEGHLNLVQYYYPIEVVETN